MWPSTATAVTTPGTSSAPGAKAATFGVIAATVLAALGLAFIASHSGAARRTVALAKAGVPSAAPEWDAMKANPNAAKTVAAITPKVAAFAPGAELVPGVVTAVAVDGHTPGHSAYDIVSGNEHLLYIGDTAHHYIVSVQRPEWTIQYDMDAPTAQASRRALLQRAADGNLRLYAVHFPFPGLGHVKAQDGNFAWVPEN